MTEIPAIARPERDFGDYALFLDFDGTLVDLAPRPDAVVVDPDLPGMLDRLRQRLGGALAIVTGREIATVDAFLAPQIFDAGGLHGVEHRLRGVAYPCRPENHPALRAALAQVKKEVASRDPGILIEDKGCTFVVHWRLAPKEEGFLRALMERVAAEAGSGYRLQLGKAIAEILPAQAGKGEIIAFLMRHSPFKGRVPIFIGDDVTDEEGFEAIETLGGLSIKVGEGPTRARLRISGPTALRSWLGEASEGRIDQNRLAYA